jgi:hypothetical protein
VSPKHLSGYCAAFVRADDPHTSYNDPPPISRVIHPVLQPMPNGMRLRSTL